MLQEAESRSTTNKKDEDDNEDVVEQEEENKQKPDNLAGKQHPSTETTRPTEMTRLAPPLMEIQPNQLEQKQHPSVKPEAAVSYEKPTVYKFLFSGLTDQEKIDYSALIEDLGIRFLE